jgi:membrane protein implicated in regulation of membrane protease activity
MIRAALARHVRQGAGKAATIDAADKEITTMDWSASTWWLIAAGVLLAAELATGTFYVLMLAIGCVFGALAGYAQISFLAQVAVAVLVGGALVLAWDRVRKRAPAGPVPAANPNINLDVGEQVQVDGWNADGTARVPYRGSSWNVRYIGDGAAARGPHVIAEVRHNELALLRA